MMNIRTLIVDDEPLIRERLRTLLVKDKRFILVAECRDGLEALKTIRNEKPDLVFLDIKMPGLNGLEVAGKLDEDLMPVIVFITAHTEFSLKAFEIHAVDYLLKPIDKERFLKLLDHLESIFDQKKDALMGARLKEFLKSENKSETTRFSRLSLKHNGKIILLNIKDIDLIEANGNYIIITSNGSEYNYKASLSAFEKQLNSTEFVRIHRSYIVNINFITDMEHMYKGEYSISLKNGTQIASSRNYKSNMNHILRNS